MYQVGDDHIRNSEAELLVETVDGSTAAKKEAPKTLHMLDIRECAIEQEYQVFTANKVVTTYRRAMAFLMSKVKKETDSWNLHPALADFEPSSKNPPTTTNGSQANGESNEMNRQVLPQFLLCFSLLARGVASSQVIGGGQIDNKMI